MRPFIFIACLLLCGSAFAQCPGGQCTRPQGVKSTATKTVKAVAAPVQKSQPIRRTFRLFRRWR